MLGPGVIHRVVGDVWRRYYRAPAEPCPSDDPPPRIDRRRGRTIAVKPKLLEFRGETFRSRAKLAEALVPMCDDRDAHAIENMLRKLGDDGEAVLDHYATRRKPKSATFASPAA